MIQPARSHDLNDKPERGGKYVLYWMQESMRTRYNHGLEYAILRANELKLPPLVCFGVTDAYPEANRRHYLFLLQGFRDVEKNLKARGIKFVVRCGPQQAAALHYAKDAALVVCDRGYVRHQRLWVDELVDGVDCRVVQVESDVVVPVDVVSDKHEFAARTIRPKLHKVWADYLKPLEATKVDRPSLKLRVTGDVDVSDPEKLLKRFTNLEPVPPVPEFFVGGEDAMETMLAGFFDRKLDGYKEGRNEPADGRTSQMSKYLHFGHVSPVDLALRVNASTSNDAADRSAYVEELIVRRELSMNFCNFEPNYDTFDCLPNWAKKTLAKHAGDKRPYDYTLEQLETAQTHDRYWNAATEQMLVSGFMHNYMRMYWGKKILEWTATPEEAFSRTLYLNNKYLMDGRDPNSFANVAWVFGLHDRPWIERPVFGQVRYMNAAGLERKYDIDRYVAFVDDISRQHGRPGVFRGDA